MQATSEAIVFKKGEYTCETKNGIATVSIPRNVTLGEIASPLARLFEGRINAN